MMLVEMLQFVDNIAMIADNEEKLEKKIKN